uniref:Uncharacterized protein n=1 Tax=Anopheles minimus TaxID=112268 RepID=A0A182WPS8_9DIPT
MRAIANCSVLIDGEFLPSNRGNEEII